MMDVRVVAVVALVTLAGCGGAVRETPSSSTTVETTTSTVEATTTTITTPASTDTAEESTTAGKEVENPWGKRNVTVAVWNSANESRDIGPLVNQTLAYWNGNGSEYADYNVTFVPTTDVHQADVLVELVPRIDECGGYETDSTVGCAPLLHPRDTPDEPIRVEIVAGYSDESTRRILEHEFGHVVGLEHGQEPMPTMQAISHFTYLSQPNIADRPTPWRNSTLSVHVDVSTLPGHDRDEAREQIRHALEYYEDGAGGAVPRNVSFVRTSNRSAADIRISVPEDSFDCAGEQMEEGSCGTPWVYDTDADDAAEFYAKYEIKLRGVDQDAIGWHVGYWLSDAMGLTGSGRPEPFVDADYDDRRDQWWKTDQDA